MEFDVPYLFRHLPALGRGLALTIQVSALAMVFRSSWASSARACA